MTAVNIRSTDPDEPGRYRIEVDGRDVSDLVCGARLNLAARELPEVELELIPRQVAITLAAGGRVVVDSETHSLLVALGWTPPDGEV